MEYFPAIAVFLFGLCVGSFLNVCIHRMPVDQSVVFPGSHCPKCQKPIAFYDNIPVLSYFVLGGKCRACKAKISPRYAVIEFFNAAGWVFLWKIFGLSPFFWAGIALFSILLAVTVTDLETGLIPDKLSLPGMAAGLAMSALWPELHAQEIWHQGLWQSALGLLTGGGILYGVGLLGNLIFRKESMGGGDIKLLAMMGAFLGFKKAMLVFLISPFPALPFALYARLAQKQETIPFGPYLATAGLLSFFCGDFLIGVILKMYGVENA